MPVDLEALKALCEKATPGPWRVIGRDNTEVAANLSNSQAIVVVDTRFFEEVTNEREKEDAAFIAAARTAMPDLIEENTALRALVVEALDFDHAAGCSGGYSLHCRCKCGRREWLVRAQAALGE